MDHADTLLVILVAVIVVAFGGLVFSLYSTQVQSATVQYGTVTSGPWTISQYQRGNAYGYDVTLHSGGQVQLELQCNTYSFNQTIEVGQYNFVLPGTDSWTIVNGAQGC